VFLFSKPSFFFLFLRPHSIAKMAPLSLTAYAGAALLFAARVSSTANFTIANGQIYTPGLVIVDAPQPGTPLGGDLIEVALDVSTNGRLQLPPYPENSRSMIHNITIFLSSYTTGRNFTITNGTASANNASLGDIMFQEPGSTVKHVKWTWPDCLVGDGGQQQGLGETDRGVYNISIRQSFRLNGEDHYTIFDLPISVTNSIPANDKRPSCDALNNPMLTPDEIHASADTSVPVMFAPGDATSVQTNLNGAANWRGGLGWLGVVALVAVLVL